MRVRAMQTAGTSGKRAIRKPPSLREEAGGFALLSNELRNHRLDYTLYNRRTRCRLTPGCPGWNYFLFDHVTYKMAMFDPEQAARWRG